MSNFRAHLSRNIKDAKTLVKSGDFDFKGNIPASFFDNPFLSENELHKVVFPQLSNNDDITSASNPIPETWYPSLLARWHKPAVPTSKLSYADGLDLYLAVSRINKAFAGVFAQRNVAEPDELEDLVANAVTDARGATQQVSVTIDLYRYYWSKNPVTLTLDAGQAYRDDPSTKPNLSFLCEVWAAEVYRSNHFVRLGGTQEQPADAQGRTVFDAQALLDGFLQEHLPALN